jgi:DNA-binding CsgD family transcriptional regulator
MNLVPRVSAERGPLDVAVVSPDSARLAALSRVIEGCGFRLVQSVEDAVVVVTDGSAPLPAHPAVLSLGRPDYGETAGQLPPDASAEQIGAAVRALAAGLSVRAREAPEEGLAAATEPASASLMTPRELEVLQLLVRGLSNKLIARQLEISQHTVKFHLESLFRKLNVRSRAQAVASGLALLSQTRVEV